MSQIKRSILSQETWDKFTKEEKTAFRELYHEKLSNAKYAESMGYHSSAKVTEDEAKEMEWYFGKENLQSNEDNSEPTELKIKTWADVEEMSEEHIFINIDNNLNLPDSVYWKYMATLKIAKLIELGYGGIVTNEEWKDDGKEKYAVTCIINKKLELLSFTTCNEKYFIAFHTREQRDEFMSYPENVKLIKLYYML